MNSPTTAERVERVQELMRGSPHRPPCDLMPWKAGDLDNIFDAKGNSIFESNRWDPQLGAMASNAVNAEVIEHLTHIAKDGFDLPVVDRPCDIKTLQDQVHAMSDRLFPNRDVKRAFLKLFEELGEVIRNPRDPKEWGDVFILMFDLSKHYGVDIKQAVTEKSADLEHRVWTETETGTYQHVPGVRVQEVAMPIESMAYPSSEGVMTHG